MLLAQRSLLLLTLLSKCLEKLDNIIHGFGIGLMHHGLIQNEQLSDPLYLNRKPSNIIDIMLFKT